MRRHNRRAGYTLVELTFSVALMAVISGAAIQVSTRGLAAVRTSNANGLVDAATGRCMSRLMAETEAVGASSLTPTLVTPVGLPRVSSDSIDFRSGTGWLAGAVLWSTDTRLDFVTDDNELEDGLDNDGDGLVDEGSLVLTRNVGDPDQQSVTLAKDLRGYLEGEILNGLDDNGNGITDERGLCFTRDGDVLHIDLTLETPGPDGVSLVRSLRNSIRIRN